MEEETIDGEPRQKAKTKFVARTQMEAQRIKVEKLMSDPVSMSYDIEKFLDSFHFIHVEQTGAHPNCETKKRFLKCYSNIYSKCYGIICRGWVR